MHVTELDRRPLIRKDTDKIQKRDPLFVSRVSPMQVSQPSWFIASRVCLEAAQLPCFFYSVSISKYLLF
jgi:hypothetical protein